MNVNLTKLSRSAVIAALSNNGFGCDDLTSVRFVDLHQTRVGLVARYEVTYPSSEDAKIRETARIHVWPIVSEDGIAQIVADFQ